MPGGVVLRMLAMLDRRVLWRVPTRERAVFLTFDDGPEPEMTPWVLDTLAAYGAKATFFCLGRNAERHPELLLRLRKEGHAVGHHTWDHCDGWRTPTRAFHRAVLRGGKQIGGHLFRAPYGHLCPAHLRALQKRYRVVMWDVMGGDFKPGRTGEACARLVLSRTRPGSIIVLHDNLKSTKCLTDALPLILEGWARLGYRCLALDKAVTNLAPL